MLKNPLNKIRDEYERNARLKPALIAILPLGAIATQFGYTVSALIAAFAGPLTTLGLTLLLAEIARDFGKRKEPSLYRSWGGKPSIAKLRHRDTSLNAITRERYHAIAAKLLGRKMPTMDEERLNSSDADVVYEAYSNLLLEKTRDHSKFRLVFEELTHYGFRRNLWGLKPLALPVASLCTLGELAAVFMAARGRSPVSAVTVTVLILDVFLLACWVWIFNSDWVKRAADSYAERLLAASEVLSASAAKRPSKKLCSEA